MSTVAVNSGDDQMVSGSIKANIGEVDEEFVIDLAVPSPLASMRVLHIISAPALCSRPGYEAAGTVPRGLTSEATRVSRLMLEDLMQQAVARRVLQTNIYATPVNNILLVHNEGRRKARAKAILRKIDSSSTGLFVDAAKYWKKDAYVVTVVSAKGSLVSAATVVTGFTHEAEELDIAVALQERRRDVTIFSDSRPSAASIVNKTTAEANEGEDPLTHIIWFPAHPQRQRSMTYLGPVRAFTRLALATYEAFTTAPVDHLT
ncbi:hypothetical protein HPB52_015161 [Rhipicephalus sanguineus]|uniref:Tick transposon n=1 Tax=Rhipicephalus sanguineus TaxID=34632 RepID=A0A9D4PZ78_RHISA|nr:hypothetical protein HPB52_015161 [Rhipicephalus sanguineus]